MNVLPSSENVFTTLQNMDNKSSASSDEEGKTKPTDKVKRRTNND